MPVRVTKLLLITLMSWSFGPTNGQSIKALPVSFSANLIYLNIPLPDNDTLVMYLDTGGKNFMYKSGLKKLEIRPTRKNLHSRVRLDEIFLQNSIPVSYKKDLYFLNDNDNTCDGMLGREWYANKIWLIDYRNKQMFAIESYSEDILSISATIPVSFRKDTSGSISNHLPGVQVVIDGDTLSMLLDTGAQAQLSDQATSAFNQSGTSSISFIDQSTFDKWEQLHPDWRVVKGGDTSLRVAEDIIEVPGVNIGDTVVGPVYFAKRADQNFVVMSNNFMDQQITGALGANALSQLGQIILDYPQQRLLVLE